MAISRKHLVLAACRQNILEILKPKDLLCLPNQEKHLPQSKPTQQLPVEPPADKQTKLESRQSSSQRTTVTENPSDKLYEASDNDLYSMSDVEYFPELDSDYRPHPVSRTLSSKSDNSRSQPVSRTSSQSEYMRPLTSAIHEHFTASNSGIFYIMRLFKILQSSRCFSRSWSLWKNFSKSEETQDAHLAFLARVVLPVVYGGIHFAAWRFEFPSTVEIILMEVRWLIIMTVFLVIFFLHHIFKLW